MGELIVNKDGSEQFNYNESGFPIRALSSRLSVFSGYAAACHWHQDAEFFIADKGDTEYFVNGETVQIKQGQAIFINSGRLHYGFSSKREECLFSVVVFSFQLMGAQFVPILRCIRLLTLDESANYLLLDASDKLGKEALASLSAIFRLCNDKPPFYELYAQSECARLTAVLCEMNQRARQNSGDDVADNGTDWTIMRKMTGFIQENYNKKLTLPQIAASGSVCVSKCCRLFRSLISETPNAYLTRYRLEKACELMRRTEYDLTAIALETGFGGASYFSEAFRKIYGESPSAYRAQWKTARNDKLS